jgi:hypothetical protein
MTEEELRREAHSLRSQVYTCTAEEIKHRHLSEEYMKKGEALARERDALEQEIERRFGKNETAPTE